jgi:hypothetical protein
MLGFLYEGRQIAEFDSRRTANGIQGVAGSNPAVPIFQFVENKKFNLSSPLHTPV